jgi:hypothetical protein
MMAGTTPRLTSENVKKALLTTTRMSVQKNNPQPPPIAGPLTLAIVGFEHAAISPKMTFLDMIS